MSAVDRIKQVLASDVLTRQLTIVPAHGAANAEIEEEERLLGRRLFDDHASLLRTWNGISLDVIRFFGCGRSTEVARLSNMQALARGIGNAIVVASDPAGFVYLQTPDMAVWCHDTDGGAIELVAANVDDWIERVIFGPGAASFGGDDWLANLRAAGIVT